MCDAPVQYRYRYGTFPIEISGELVKAGWEILKTEQQRGKITHCLRLKGPRTSARRPVPCWATEPDDPLVRNIPPGERTDSHGNHQGSLR